MFGGKKIKELETKLIKVQHACDVLSADVTDRAVTSRANSGNPYGTCDEAIKALSMAYEGVADWGVQQTRNIVDLRAAFTLGSGIQISLKKGYESKGERELEFLEEFMRLNDLDEEMPLELAKEAELEGRTLLLLSKDEDNQNIKVRHISYSTLGYKVITDPADYKKYMKVEYTEEGQQRTKEAKDFVYKKFAGRLNKVNQITPKVATVLSSLENLDKALCDWRSINKYFATPTPYFKCATQSDAKSFNDALKNVKWKIGKFLAGIADFSLVTPNSNGGTDSLREEITMCVKIISGQTGIPVHFLGLPDLMSNRSTSTDLFELITASTLKERKVWLGCYDELFKKVLTQANVLLQKGFDPDVINKGIQVDIPMVSAAKMQELVTVWLPLYEANAIDLATLLTKIPDVNVEDVTKSLKDETALDIAKNTLTNLKAADKQQPTQDPKSGGNQNG